MKAIVLDVEGTTTAIAFVQRTLFPYAAAKLASFLAERARDPGVVRALDAVKATLIEEEGGAPSLADCHRALARWIDLDRKHPALKEIEGWIWERGYAAGELAGHVYPDVPAAFARWTAAGLGLAIYSSGSVLAQRLLFAHSSCGDLARHLSHYFDTGIGPKRAPPSYAKIADQLKHPPRELLFLSDTVEELRAANTAGFAVMQLVREGAAAPSGFEQRPDFTSIA